MPSGRPSIGIFLHGKVEETLRQRPDLGYRNTGELVRDLLRRWLREHGVEAPPEATTER